MFDEPCCAAAAPDDQIIRQPRISRWTLLFILLLVLIVGTRLWDLGSRAYCHDEAIHAWESWKLANGLGYVHDPAYHGPFLYHLTALVFALLGDTEVTGRLAAAVGGILVALSPWLLRRWLGRWGALAAMLFMALSPVLMHRSRYIRHDQFAIVANLVLFWAILRYLELRRTRDLYIVAAAVAWGLTTKETTFITYALFGVFLAAYALWQWRRETGLKLRSAQTWRALAGLPVFDLLVVIGTLVLPTASPFLIALMGRDPVDVSAQGIMLSTLVWLGVALVAAAIGLLWDRRRWLVCVGLFYLIFAPLYTTMFSNAQGFATGMVGQLGYWLSQQGVRRGSQPWFYYFLILGMYEFAALAVGLPTLVWAGVRALASAAQAAKPAPATRGMGTAPTELAPGARGMGTAPTELAPTARGVGTAPTELALTVRGMGTAPTELAPTARGEGRADHSSPRAPFVPLVAWWFLGALLLYTWAGEKMPWLAMHLVVTLHLLAGWGLGKLLSSLWASPSPPAPLPPRAWERGGGGASAAMEGGEERPPSIAAMGGGPVSAAAADKGAPSCGEMAAPERGEYPRAGPDAPSHGLAACSPLVPHEAGETREEGVTVAPSPPLPRSWWERGQGGEGRFDLLLLIVAPLLALFALINGRALGGGSSLNAWSAYWLRWIVAALMLAWLAWLALRRGVRRMLRLAALSIVAALLALTVRVAWNAAYRHADLASEFLVYAQGSPDVPRVAHDVEALSYRLTGGLDIKLAYDEDAAWPFIWYFRNYTNAQYFRERPAEPLDADVVIVGEINEAKLRPLLEEDYVGRQYRLIWWPNEDWYKAWAEPGKGLWQQLSSAEGRGAIWDVLWSRKYEFSLQEWPGHLVHTFTVYVRKDLAVPLWAPGR